jgi:hypothetical protein
MFKKERFLSLLFLERDIKMDKNELTRLIYQYINAKYSKGYTRFKNEGGYFIVDPIIDDQILIYHPDLPKELIDELSRFSSPSFKYINSINFKNLSEKEIEEQIWDATLEIQKKFGIKSIIYEYRNKIALFVSINDKGLTGEIIKSISTTLLSIIPQLKQGYIIYEEEIFPFGNFDTKRSSVIERINGRERPINHDDVLNTIIAINQEKDVLDIIDIL